MKKPFIVFILITFMALGTVFAASGTAVVESFSGKVEFRTNDGAWIPVSKGMELPLKSVISTGFNSKAVLNLGRSTLYVEPLSRMSIQTLAEKDGVVSTDLFLQVGKVKSEVRSVKGLQTDFKISSPITTASVRGTVFTFDSVNLDVDEGVVVMTDRYRQELIALAGEKLQFSGDGEFSGSFELIEGGVIITPDTSDVNGPQGLGSDVSSVIVPTADLEYGSIRIIWNVNQ